MRLYRHLLNARTWLTCFGIASVLGLLLAWQRWTASTRPNKPEFWTAEYIQPAMIPWYTWALIAPILMLALHQVASTEMAKRRRVAAYTGLALLAIALQTVVSSFALGWWWSFPNPIPVDPAWHIMDQLRNKSAMSVLVVWVIGATYHATWRAAATAVPEAPTVNGSAPPLLPTSGPIALKAADRVWFVDPVEILWVEADGDYVVVHTAQKKHRVRETISALEQRLPANDFVRVSRSAIVNVSAIKEAQRWFRGNLVVILRDGTKVTTGARYRDRLTGRIPL